MLPLLLVACRAGAPAVSSPTAAPPPPLPSSPAGVVDEAALDRATDPCQDFFQFACGGWIKATPIPPDRPLWSRSFSEILERNQVVLRGLLEKDAAGQPAGGPDSGKLGDFYASCMDEAKVEAAGAAPLRPWLSRIEAVRDGRSLAQVVAELQLHGVTALFDFRQQQDFKDATQVIGLADQGGLGLPDRDYYTRDDERSVELRREYQAHVARMLGLLGEPAGPAGQAAAAIVALETELARASLRRADRRDPARVYHRLERAGLVKQAPHFDWPAYLAALGVPEVQQINVAVPGFFAALDEVVKAARLPELRAYLRWQLVHAAAPALSARFVDEDFGFSGRRLTGAEQLRPRWKRCVEATDVAMGFALGQQFVAATFGEDGKTRSLQMLERVEQAFRDDVAALAWMDPPTRGQALDKLAHIVNKIGYPDVPRSYDRLVVDRARFLDNRLRASAVESERELARIGKPLDRRDWRMTPPTVNAYYNASLNEMVFPAGILQPPFFDRAAGDPSNYGGIGMVIGHELTHGFDDRGRKFDGLGNLRDWWTPEVGKAFEARADCVARQYSGYVAIDDLHLDGRLTLGENIGDLGGLKLAFAALAATRSGRGPAAAVAGFSEEQQFFVGYAQSWCASVRPAEARRRVTVDPHSPPRFRVDGVVRNLPQFQAAFGCATGAPMAPSERCAVW